MSHKPSVFTELWTVFTRGFNQFFGRLIQFVATSAAIVRLQPISWTNEREQDPFIADTKYAYLVFEYLLILLILARLFGSEAVAGEVEELFQEFVILLFYFLEILIVLLMASFCQIVFFKNVEKRYIQACFLYAFSLPFLPFYLITYLAYDALSDSDAFDGVLVVLWLVCLLFFGIYFYKLAKNTTSNGFKSIVISIFLSTVLSVALLFSVAAIAGAAFGDSA